MQRYSILSSKPLARHARLALAIAVAIAWPVHTLGAAENVTPDHDRERAKALDKLVVTATPLGQGVEEVAKPVEVLAGAALDERKANSLGATLESLPGVQSSYFGPGVGRPVIRGLDGARVQVLSGGISSQDASTVSVDHAVSIEPFLADQIEVLKGPATLLYGSGAIGGAVNVVDGRIPERVHESAEGLSGRAELRGNTVDDERTGMLRLDGGGGPFAFHADLFRRSTDDVSIPGFAESAELLAEEGESPDPDSRGVLENSAVRTESAAVGASLIGERGFIGGAFSFYDTLYGVPGHAHHHGHEDDDHAHRKDGDDEDHEGEEEAVTIDLRQRRSDMKLGLDEPFAGHERITLRVGSTRYQHTELEGDEVGTVFESRGTEARLESIHHPISGWKGAWGLQHGRRDFSAEGEEAFVPPSLTRDIGVFLIEEQQFDRLKVELGARADRVRVTPDDGPRATFDTLSLSAAGRWTVDERMHLQLGFDRAERAPTAEELYSDGPHVATRSYEIGDADLGTERADRVELGLHWHVEGFEAKLAAYHSRFDDFIYLADTDEEEDELPVRVWTQEDARFDGFEVEGKWRLAESTSGRWDLRAFGDLVRGRLDAGGDLPRIAPARAGADLAWQRDGWRARLGAVHHARQDRVAEMERETPGYTLVNAHLSYHWDTPRVGWELFLDGTNLTDREARAHTSFLKDLAPLPGRGIAFGVRAFF